MLVKKQKLKDKLMVKEHYLAILQSYPNDTLQNTEETCYRMYHFWYKRKLKQGEILLAYMGLIHSIMTTHPALKESIRHMVDPGKVTYVRVPAGRPTSD